MMKLLCIVLLLDVTRVRLHIVPYQQDTVYRNGWWRLASGWWQNEYQPSYPRVQAPLYVAPFVVTATEHAVDSLPPVIQSIQPTAGPNVSKRNDTSTETVSTIPETTIPEKTTTEVVTRSTVTTVTQSVTDVTVSSQLAVVNITGSFMNDEDDILSKCESFRPRALREACRRVVKNPVLKTDGVRGYVGDEEFNQGSFITTRGFVLTQSLGRQLICDPEDPDECPNLLENNRGRTGNLRSTSPWKICQEYDPNRFPQWIKTAQCLCEGCIDLRTAREDSENVVSQPLTIDITVIRKDSISRKFTECNSRVCREEQQSIAVGCHCALINMFTVT